MIELLLSGDYNNPETRFTRIVALGGMLQAAFLTSSEGKERAIEFASRRMMNCYDDFVSAIRATGNEKIIEAQSRLLLIEVLNHVFARNYTSKYLLDPLANVYEALRDYGDAQSARFFISSALAHLGSYGQLLDFASDPKMIDTSLFALSKAALSQEELKGDERKKYLKVDKRTGLFRKAINKELKSLLGKNRARIIRTRGKKKKT
jgi:hypothetical protein